VTARMLLEYDGAPFAGWARQPGRRTVQAEVEQALATVLRRDVSLTVAGRTDSGVHALGQVASHAGDPVNPARLNGLLPPEIAVRTCEAAAQGFDARRDARSRTYCYRVLARRERSALERHRALWWPHPLDPGALDECARALVGTHDFTAFTPTESHHRTFARTVMSARWEREGDLLAFWIEADSFLRHMNRVLVRTMFEVAGGQRSMEAFLALLAGRPRSEAAATAPAHGLHLVHVRYDAPGSGGGVGPRLPSQAP